ncbi:MAG: DUF805 domain-containing protein [Granulosicoccaceae bacterium]
MSAVATAEAFAAPESEIEFQGEEIQQKLFSARGRVGVLKYFGQTFLWSVVFMLVIAALFAAASAMGLVSGGPEAAMGGVAIISGVVMLPYLYIMICFGVKRLHDINMSGWFMLLLFVPIVNIFFGLYMMLKPGKAEANRFGAQSETKGWEKVVGWIYIVLMVAGFAAGLLGMGAGGLSMMMAQ